MTRRMPDEELERMLATAAPGSYAQVLLSELKRARGELGDVSTQRNQRTRRALLEAKKLIRRKGWLASLNIVEAIEEGRHV